MNESAISSVDIDSTKAVLEDLLQKVVQDVSAEDIETLESIRKIYKKTIPFSKRMYVASYLLAQYMTGGKGAHAKGSENAIPRGKAKFERGPSREPKPKAGFLPKSKGGEPSAPKQPLSPSEGKITVKIESPIIKSTKTTAVGEKAAKQPCGKGDNPSAQKMPKVTIPESEAAAIFISIGRGRKVFPRDLVGLLVNAAGISRERIGDIRVLPSYSFVQLYKDDANIAIAKLNGYDYRGKQLSVSYSKEKADGTTPQAPHKAMPAVPSTPDDAPSASPASSSIPTPSAAPAPSFAPPSDDSSSAIACFDTPPLQGGTHQPPKSDDAAPVIATKPEDAK